MKYTLRTILFMIKAYFASKWVMLKARRKPEKERFQDVYEYFRVYCPGLMKATGSRIIYHGLENLPEKPGALYVSNHQSLFDIVVILAVMEYPTAFVNKKELEKTIFVGQLMHNIGCVWMDRNDLRQSLEAIKQASERLREGLNMVIFPEGTRSKNGQMGEFKKGSLKAATMAGAPVVPVRITSSIRDILENNKGIKIVPQEVHVYFGEPIDVASMTRKEQKELAENIQSIVAELN